MEFGAAAFPLYPGMLTLVSGETAAPAAAPSASAGAAEAHWEAGQVAWNPTTMVAWPAGEAAPERASPTRSAPEPSAAVRASCCQVPGCTEQPEAMREYNMRCRCAQRARLFYTRKQPC